MNVRLKHSMSFRAGVHFNTRFFICEYTLNLWLSTGTIDIHEQNVALSRIQKMIYHEFSDCVFVNQADTKQIKLYKAANMKVSDLPDDPLDQIVGIMLYCKLNAVAEGRLVIHELELASDQGDNMFFCHSAEENIGPFSAQSWWHDSSRKISNIKGLDKNIVAMQDRMNWAHYGLDWGEDQNLAPGKDSVVLPFRKDDNQ
jgi:hypothetical protein